MNWKPIVVGVDGSAASVRAAAAGVLIARRAGTTCKLVAAVPHYERILMSQGMVIDAAQIAADAVARDRAVFSSSLAGNVPKDMVDDLEIQAGNPAVVLKNAAVRLGAGLIIIGSRPHAGVDRLRARIGRYLVRAAGVPVLVTNGGSPVITRVLTAIDLSYASQRTLDAAHSWARLFGAQLRVLHAREPVPPFVTPLGPMVNDTEVFENRLQRSRVWAGISESEAEKVVRFGEPAATIRAEAADWKADLLVVGSHGGGWADRLLIGSTAEHVLDHPPVMTLIVPSGRPAADNPLDIGAMPWEERDLEAAVPASRE